jgi:hypothetical protein
MNPRLSSSKLLIKQRSTKTGQAILGQAPDKFGYAFSKPSLPKPGLKDPYAMIGQCKTQHPNDK